MAGKRIAELGDPVAPKWREEDGVIISSVTSNGTTGTDWIRRLEVQGFKLSPETKQVLRSPNFKPTRGVTTVFAILKGVIFRDNNRVTSEICTVARKHELSPSQAELACLICEKFTDNDIVVMGLSCIVTMLEPASNGESLCLILHANRPTLITACVSRPESKWNRVCGFLFTVSERPAV